MMNKIIAISAFSILIALVLLRARSYANVPGIPIEMNNMSSGDPDLQIGSNGTDFFHSISNVIDVSGIKPNEPKTAHVWFKNTSAGAISLDAKFDTVAGTGVGATPGSFLERDLLVKVVCTDGESVSEDTFKNWESTKTFTGTLAAGQKTDCTVTATYPVGNFNDFGQTLTFNAVFNANQ